jgi:hypothetical protein
VIDVGPIQSSRCGFAHCASGDLGAVAIACIEFFARCGALEDLAYGRATGRRECVTNTQRSFAWLFPGQS